MDAEFIRELFREFGPVQVRRMFGGAGIYADGVIFGIVVADQIYLKADVSTAPGFEREGCRPFEYSTKAGKHAVMPYWRLLDRLYDDADELAQWARQALAVAHVKNVAKPRKALAGKKRVAKKAKR